MNEPPPDNNITLFLESVSLFADLPPDARSDLAKELGSRSFNQGDLVFTYGDVGNELWIVLEGTIELSVRDTTGDKIVLTHLGPAEVFGELSLLDGGPRSASATAIEPSRALSLTRDRLRSFLISHPSCSLLLLGVLARRIRETDRLLMNRVTRNLNAQVAHEMSFVQRLASRIANGTGGIPFLFLNIIAFSFWILANVGIIPGITPFDPYPFDLLTLAVSLEAILLSILVLLAQNLQATKDRLRGEIEYEVNLKAELEVAELHGKLDHLHTELVRALREINAR